MKSSKKRSNYCAAFWCNNCTGVRLDAPVSFFSFPKEEWRAKKWLKFTLREDLIGLDVVEIKNLRLCSDHFQENCYRKKHPKPLLSRDAVPTLPNATGANNAGPNNHDVPTQEDSGGLEISRTVKAATKKNDSDTNDHGDSTQDSGDIDISERLKTATGESNARTNDRDIFTRDSGDIEIRETLEADLGHYCWV